MHVRQIQKILKSSMGNLAGARRAIMFSGGFDSMLMALLARRYGARVTAVTIRFDDFNPVSVAEAVLLARRMGLPHHIVHVTLSEFLSAPRSLASLINEPLSDLDLVLVYAAFKKYDPKSGGKIFISGMGSDQLFGDEALKWKEEEIKGNLEHAALDRDAHHKVAEACGYKFIFPFVSTPMLALAQQIPAALKKDKKLLRQLVTGADMDLLSGRGGGRREIQVPTQVRNLLAKVSSLRELKKIAISLLRAERWDL